MIKTDERTLKLTNLIRKIGKVSSLNSRDLVEISRDLFDLTILCGCDEHDYYSDIVKHKCTVLFNRHDSKHTPACLCCQTKMLLYYLGKCMDKLASEDRLPEFSKNHLSSARISERTYGHVKNNSKLIFQIKRHYNAWRDEPNMKVIIQRWEFDFQSLSLSEMNYGLGI